MSNRAVPPDREAEFLETYRQGASLMSLARDFGCSRNATMRTLRRLGNPPRANGTWQRRQFTQEYVAEILAMWASGHRTRPIARKIQTTQDAVVRVLRENGVEVVSRPKPPGPFGPDSPSWKGGRLSVEGYAKVWVSPDDPMASMRDAGGYAPEHRLVMARHLGRPLDRHETVHHKDGVRDHNEIDNLQLRQGNHGKGAAWTCQDCGSLNVRPSAI